MATKEVKIIYMKAPDYRLVPATGAWGGPSVTSEIIVNFYVDRAQEPTDVTLLIDEQTGTAVEKPLPPPQNVREVLVGIVLRPDIALAIGQFLVEKANLVMKKTNAPTN
jgi:hypothetical protein